MAHLIRAQVLHRVDIVKVELVPGDKRIDSLQSRLEIATLGRALNVNRGACSRRITYLLVHSLTNHEPRPPIFATFAFVQLWVKLAWDRILRSQRKHTCHKAQGCC